MQALQFLIVAPDGRDAAVIVSQLGKAGMTGVATSDVSLLAAIAGDELVCAILTLEAFRSIDPEAFGRALAAQAPWSDCPLLVLTHRIDRVGARTAFDSLGNVMVLERPMHPQSLVRAARQAMRARERQYRAAAYLRHKEAAEAQLRVMAETLETRVIARTVQLSDALAERAAIAAQLHAREEQYRLTIELSNQIPFSADPDGNMLSVGSRWVPLADLPTGTVTETGWRARVNPEDIDVIDREWLVSSTHGVPLDMEFRLRMPDDSYRWHRARAAPQFAADRSVLKWYGTIEDIEESRQADNRLIALQGELIHISRLSAMGAMASTLAHELNQPLTAATNYLRGCRRLLEKLPGEHSAELINAIDSADRSAARAGEIVRRLRDMVSRGGVAQHPENLADLIREACALALIDASQHGIAVRINVADETVMVEVDRIQIQQVLMNLLRNAVEALDQVAGAEIVITAQTNDGWSEIIVKDNGPGIPAATRERLFEPFNSSKSQGMGIGLSISRTIIEGHGGRIALMPFWESGTVIRFTLPNADPVAHADAADPSA